MIALLLAAAVSLAAAPPPPPPRITPAARVSTLKNGLQVVRVPFHSPGLVAYYTAVRVGSRNEVEAGHTGFAHFFEHMMFRGTRRFPEGARGALLGKLGFAENAFTSDDLTMYHVSGPTSALGTLVDVEADRFMNLEYAEGAFQTEAKAVLGEYNKNAANPGLKVEESLLETAFTTHPYRHTTLGFLADIEAMPTRYEYSKQFFKRWYTPDNCIIFVVGDFDDQQLMASIEKAYGGWKGTAAKLTVPVEPKQTAPRAVKVAWKTPTLPRHVECWKTPAASRSADLGAAQQVLGAYLAGETSPLYKELVLEKQLVESLGPNAEAHRDPNLFCLEAKLTDEQHRAPVAKAMHDAVAHVLEGGVDAARVQAIVDHLHFALLMSFESQDDVALALAYPAAVFGPVDALERAAQATLRVTPRALVDFAKANLVDAGRTTLTFEAPTRGGAP